jgi:hypothetical protein
MKIIKKINLKSGSGVYSIGDRIEYEGEILEVHECTTCSNCYFNKKSVRECAKFSCFSISPARSVMYKLVEH